MAIVGDTEKDLQLAKKNSGAGCGISVLCGVGSEEELSVLADFCCVKPGAPHPGWSADLGPTIGIA
ncbi:hypothetical protein GCM10020331_027200 [Ectobacillus funiculus]